MKLPAYDAYHFDCDGVLLDSNAVKSKAFHDLGLTYGADVADALHDHHVATGGVSRFQKVRWMHTELLGHDDADPRIEADILRYGDLCREGLATCAVLPGVRGFLDALPRSLPRYVISGGLQTEVVHAMKVHSLDFDGVLGSPKNKHEHFTFLREQGVLSNAVYFGDSKYDHVVSDAFDVDFVFLTGASEFRDWPAYFADRDCPVVAHFTELELGH